MSLIAQALQNLDSQIAEESAIEQAKEAKKAAKLAKQKEMLAQPGYIFDVFFNRNAPFTQSQGFYLTSCRLASTENGASPLPQELESEFTAWSYESVNTVNRLRSKGMGAFKVSVFIPQSYFQSEDKYPMIEIDTIMNLDGVNGRLAVNADGHEIVVVRGEAIPAGYETVKEDAFKFYIESHLIIGSETSWDPLAKNPHKGLDAEAFKTRLAKSAALHRRKQEAGLQQWRNNQTAQQAPATSAMSASVAGAEQPAKTTRSKKAVV